MQNKRCFVFRQILVYDFDQFSRDECIGQMLIALADVSEHLVPEEGGAGRVTLWRPLTPYERKEEVSVTSYARKEEVSAILRERKEEVSVTLKEEEIIK